MADRYPLVVASGTVQEIPNGDNLNLQGNDIVNASSVSATTASVTTINATNAVIGVATFSSTVASMTVGILTVTQVADDFFAERSKNLSGIATHYTQGIVQGGSGLYSGGTYSADGKIYYAPWVNNSYYVYDTVTGIGSSVTLTSISPPITAQSHEPNSALYSTGILASNNCIYFIPYHATSVLKLNTITGVASTIAITGVGTTGTYHGGILATNGKIYGAPHSANAWLEINPANDTAQRISIGIVNSGIAYSGNNSNGQNWLGCVENPYDGTIHAVPFKSTVVLRYNPNSGINTTYGNFGTGASKFRGGVFFEGKIYCSPDQAGYIGVIDPVGLTTAGFGTGGTGAGAYQGICAAPDGKLYAKPSTAQRILQIDPQSETVKVIGQSLSANGYNGVAAPGHGGVVDSNGRLYLAPYGENGITITQLYGGRPTPYLLSPYSNYSH